MKVLKKIVNIFIDVIVVLILIVSALILTLTLTTSSETGASNLFGYTFNSIQSQSMEPVFYKGDMIIGKISEEDATYNVGDVVIYSTIQQNDEGQDVYYLVCHRIIDTKVTNGTVFYLTQGDNNDISDEGTVGWLTTDKIVGVFENNDYQGTVLSGVGSVYDFLQSFWGFFFVIVLPMIIFFIYELIRVILNLMAYSKEKALVAAQEAAQSAELSEQQKQKAIEEYLAQQAEKEKQAQSQNDSAD
jgi:signal peptidase